MAGVSHQTVSRVINHSPDVSDATREKVQKAIDALGYRPSNSARALASHRSRTIGLVAGGQRFYGPISAISSIEAMARQHGLFMSVSMVHEALCSQTEFDELCSTFDEMNVDAFIFLTPTGCYVFPPPAVRRSRTARHRHLHARQHQRAGWFALDETGRPSPSIRSGSGPMVGHGDVMHWWSRWASFRALFRRSRDGVTPPRV